MRDTTTIRLSTRSVQWTKRGDLVMTYPGVYWSVQEMRDAGEHDGGSGTLVISMTDVVLIPVDGHELDPLRAPKQLAPYELPEIRGR